MAIYIDRNKPSSGLANLLASKGRHGDTELVHMTKPEIQRLRNTGLMTLNPKTGLPEMFLGDVFKGLKTYAKNFLKPKNLIPTLAGIAAPMIAGPWLSQTGLGQFLGSAGTRAALTGLGVTAGSLPFQPLPKALQAGTTAGLLNYGMSKVGDALSPGPEAYGLAGERQALNKARIDSMKNVMKKGGFRSVDTDISYEDFVDQFGDIMDIEGSIPDQLATNFESNFSKLSPQDQRKLLPVGDALSPGWTTAPAKSAGGARDFIKSGTAKVVDTGKLKPYELSSWGPSSAAKEQALNKYMLKKRFLPSPEFRNKVLDPWEPLREQVSSADGLGSLKGIAKAIPLGEVAKTVGSVQEGIGLTERGLEGYTEEELEDIQNQLIQPNRYTPTRPGGVRYFTPTRRTAIIPRRADKGGLVSLAHGGDMRKDFEGLVQGRGHGMQDNVIMDIKQKGGLLAVSPKEYVVPADVMANLGNGNPDAGAEHMDKFISDFRKKKYGRDKQPPEMDGGTALQSLMA